MPTDRERAALALLAATERPRLLRSADARRPEGSALPGAVAAAIGLTQAHSLADEVPGRLLVILLECGTMEPREALAVCALMPREGDALWAFEKLVPALPAGSLEEAAEVARSFSSPALRARALADVALRSGEDLRAGLARQALSACLERPTDGQALRTLLPLLAEEERLDLLRRALDAAAGLQDADQVSWLIAGVAPHLTPELLPRAVAAAEPLDRMNRGLAFAALAPREPALLDRALRDAAEEPNALRLASMAKELLRVAPAREKRRLASLLLERCTSVYAAMQAIEALLPYLGAGKEGLAQEGCDRVLELVFKSHSHDWERSVMLASLSRAFPGRREELLKRSLDLLEAATREPWHYGNPSPIERDADAACVHQFNALFSVSAATDPETRLRLQRKALALFEEEPGCVSAYEGYASFDWDAMAQRLDPSLREEALRAALMIGERDYFLLAVTPALEAFPPEGRREALETVLARILPDHTPRAADAIAALGDRAAGLELVRRLAGRPPRAQALEALVTLAPSCGGPDLIALAGRLPGSGLEPEQALSIAQGADSLPLEEGLRLAEAAAGRPELRAALLVRLALRAPDRFLARALEAAEYPGLRLHLLPVLPPEERARAFEACVSLHPSGLNQAIQRFGSQAPEEFWRRLPGRFCHEAGQHAPPGMADRLVEYYKDPDDLRIFVGAAAERLSDEGIERAYRRMPEIRDPVLRAYFLTSLARARPERFFEELERLLCEALPATQFPRQKLELVCRLTSIRKPSPEAERRLLPLLAGDPCALWHITGRLSKEDFDAIADPKRGELPHLLGHKDRASILDPLAAVRSYLWDSGQLEPLYGASWVLEGVDPASVFPLLDGAHPEKTGHACDVAIELVRAAPPAARPALAAEALRRIAPLRDYARSSFLRRLAPLASGLGAEHIVRYIEVASGGRLEWFLWDLAALAPLLQDSAPAVAQAVLDGVLPA